MKKLLKLLTAGLMIGAVALGVSQLKSEEPVRTEASAPTKRVWLDFHELTWWGNDPDESIVGIHYWGGSSSSTYAGVAMTKDNANNLWYYDVPSDTTSILFSRIKKSTPNDVFNKTEDIALESNVNTIKHRLLNKTGDYGHHLTNTLSFSPAITDKVNVLHESINTKAKACGETAAETAIMSYNAMPTFEQNQYATMDVGGGVTGLQRLNYLKNFYELGIVIGAVRTKPKEDRATIAILAIGGLSVLSLGGYFFLKKKGVA